MRAALQQTHRTLLPGLDLKWMDDFCAIVNVSCLQRLLATDDGEEAQYRSTSSLASQESKDSGRFSVPRCLLVHLKQSHGSCLLRLVMVGHLKQSNSSSSCLMMVAYIKRSNGSSPCLMMVVHVKQSDGRCLQE